METTPKTLVFLVDKNGVILYQNETNNYHAVIRKIEIIYELQKCVDYQKIDRELSKRKGYEFRQWHYKKGFHITLCIAKSENLKFSLTH